MASSSLAQHLPSLFGPGRRAAWRLSLVRRGLAAAALLLALQLTLGAAAPPSSPTPEADAPSGPTLSLPLALPADHLSAGDEVGVYLPGRESPVVASTRFGGTSEAPSGGYVARITLRDQDVGPLLRQMAPDGAGGGGFVLVGRARPDTGEAG
ncbi:MAG TPA: hypothetical protein DER11_06855 [Janibacter terrae]|uniref:hypothetical protein n=1 Tax=Janibacter terrae TaxID=103817 RepID=UPI0008390297|nr:hypothetical protein [Janibacter terrae]HCE61078.1 hypothetical protein [Janibacter terrae]